MFSVAAVAVVTAMAVALARAFLGPTLYDRVLAGNSFGTKTVLLIGLMGFLTGRPDFLDIAILYALINFAALVAILKFFRYRTLSVSMSGQETDKPEFATDAHPDGPGGEPAPTPDPKPDPAPNEAPDRAPAAPGPKPEPAE